MTRSRLPTRLNLDDVRALRDETQAWLDGAREASYDEFFEKRVILYHCNVALGIRRARRGGSKERSLARCVELLARRDRFLARESGEVSIE